MLALAGIIAFFGIIFWAVVSLNKQAYDGYGLLGWLVIIFILGPILVFVVENNIFWETLIIGNIIMWSLIIWGLDRY